MALTPEQLRAQIAGVQVRVRRVDDLVPYAMNARTHSEWQVKQIAASMQEFGYTSPVLLDGEDGILAGHGRVLAAYQLGLTEIPTIDLAHLSDVQKRAYVLADNKLALNAGWDVEMLKAETDALLAAGYDLGLTGFTTDELAEMFANANLEADEEKDPDDAPPLPLVTTSQPGDVWILGPHRIMCGDSTEQADWTKLMGEEEADCVWTDPPYNVAYESKLAGSIQNDSMNDASFRAFLYAAYSCLFRVMKPGASIYVAHADTEGLNFRGAFKDAGFKLSGCLIWRKDSLVLGRSDFQWMHEPILYGWKPGSRHKWFGGRKQTTVIEHGAKGPIRQRDDGKWVIEVGDTVLVVDGQAQIEESPASVIYHEKPKRSAEHPTMKPVALVERFLRFSARPSDIVVDAFGGSGTTLMAAERMGMCARLMELDPKFADVIVRRWCEYTGRKAVHQETGREWDGQEGEA